MPRITDAPPPEIAAELAELRTALDQDIPAKVLDRNLLIATWNIWHLDGVTEKWVSEPDDRPKRDLHALLCIAEILSRFDVIAIQEVRRDAQALKHLLKILGPNWGLMLTDITAGRRGNLERLAYLFDIRKVTPSGLACELVIPREKLERATPGTLDRQFTRTPYAVGFRSRGKTFTLVGLHVIWGNLRLDEERSRELRTIAKWLEEWATSRYAWDRNLITLGTFQIDREGSELYRAFTSTGLHIPPDLLQVRRSIMESPGGPVRLYDQIAWFEGDETIPGLSLEYLCGGSFDFVPVALRSRNLDRRDLMHYISDRLPLWAEFSVRG